MSGLNEGNRANEELTDEQLLASTNMRDLLKVSPEKMATLDKETNEAASMFRNIITKTGEPNSVETNK